MKKLIILALLPIAANAEFLSGNELLERIRSTDGRRNTALGYIMGVHDVTWRTLHCSPQTVTAGQVLDMVEQALIKTPEQRHVNADAYVIAALQSAWPCPRRESKGTML